MQFSSWRRHQLRAQGRVNRRLGRSASNISEQAEVLACFPTARPQDSASRSAQLLNFLAHATAQAEKAILSPTPVPEFARMQPTEADAELHALLNSRRRLRRPTAASRARQQVEEDKRAESILGMLAETLQQEAVSASSGDSPGGTLAPLLGPLSQSARGDAHAGQAPTLTEALIGTILPEPADDPLKLDQSLSERYARCMADLDRWLGVDWEEEGQKRREKLPPFYRLPAALPPIVPECELPFDEPKEVLDVTLTLHDGQKVSATSNIANARYRRFVSKKQALYKPRLDLLPNGSRRERFKNGAELIKDALGRVLEIRTIDGISVQVHYDSEGKPDSFIRLCKSHRAHSLGERDRHGVVVRDPEGRVRAAGESMFVDPSGCVSVRRHDGQFCSLDLVRGIHIERRSVRTLDGGLHMLTALFSADGFRMATRFQHVNDGTSLNSWLPDEKSGTFRFYGRDGSVIEFHSEEDVLQLKPARLWQPGSRSVQAEWKRFHQAGTAWDSVQEYITNYLLV